MTLTSRKKPLWLWGMANACVGLVGGYCFVPLAQMLVARGLPQAQVDTVVANCLLPGFWTFAISPLVDVRFSRRWWAVFFAVLAGAAMAGALASASVLAIEALLITAYAAAIMSSNALGGWLATLITREEEARMSAWTQVAAFLGYGTMAILPDELVGRVPARVEALLLGLLVAAPATVCAVIPLPAEEVAEAKRLAESFGTFWRELRALLRSREVLLALPLFLAPAASFALTNNLSGLGKDFHAPDLFVSRASGVLLAVAGLPGCLLMPLLAKKVRPLLLYFGVAVVGAMFTLSLVWLPHNPVTFVSAVMGENIFQAFAYTTEVAIVFEMISAAARREGVAENPLAGTQFGLLTAATVLPINYMGRLDGWAYGRLGGLSGELLVDAGMGLLACAVLLPMLRVLRRNGAG